jgi:hypothetical protein
MPSRLELKFSWQNFKANCRMLVGNLSSFTLKKKKGGRPLQSIMQLLLISCMEILFLKLAATIFGLD